jgi:Fe2+ or Zn2+ uptake regulation protein
VSLATVYRNLRRLAAEGLLRERADARGLRFDGNTAPHDHFTCIACARVYDVPPLASGTLRTRVVVSSGFEILDHRVEFYGRCAACRGRRRSPVTAHASPVTADRSPVATQRRKHGRTKSQRI